MALPLLLVLHAALFWPHLFRHTYYRDDTESMVRAGLSWSQSLVQPIADHWIPLYVLLQKFAINTGGASPWVYFTISALAWWTLLIGLFVAVRRVGGVNHTLAAGGTSIVALNVLLLPDYPYPSATLHTCLGLGLALLAIGMLPREGGRPRHLIGCVLLFILGLLAGHAAVGVAMSLAVAAILCCQRRRGLLLLGFAIALGVTLVGRALVVQPNAHGWSSFSLTLYLGFVGTAVTSTLLGAFAHWSPALVHVPWTDAQITWVGLGCVSLGMTLVWLLLRYHERFVTMLQSSPFRKSLRGAGMGVAVMILVALIEISLGTLGPEKHLSTLLRVLPALPAAGAFGGWFAHVRFQSWRKCWERARPDPLIPVGVVGILSFSGLVYLGRLGSVDRSIVGFAITGYHQLGVAVFVAFVLVGIVRLFFPWSAAAGIRRFLGFHVVALLAVCVGYWQTLGGFDHAWHHVAKRRAYLRGLGSLCDVHTAMIAELRIGQANLPVVPAQPWRSMLYAGLQDKSLGPVLQGVCSPGRSARAAHELSPEARQFLRRYYPQVTLENL